MARSAMTLSGLSPGPRLPAAGLAWVPMAVHALQVQ